MRNKLFKIKRFFYTIYDVGLSRLFARVKYEIRKKGDILIGPKLALYLCKLDFTIC